MITALIKRIAQYLDENKVPYMIIGGQAVLLYGTPRLTRDIDLAYIRRWLTEFSSLPEHERIGEDFERLIEGLSG